MVVSAEFGADSARLSDVIPCVMDTVHAVSKACDNSPGGSLQLSLGMSVLRCLEVDLLAILRSSKSMAPTRYELATALDPRYLGWYMGVEWHTLDQIKTELHNLEREVLYIERPSSRIRTVVEETSMFDNEENTGL